ncbi:MAG TPA: hypothetical protein VFK44_00305 [Bacillales bacterium]|nr:hypothetical protein [Bacillales bacterium]
MAIENDQGTDLEEEKDGEEVVHRQVTEAYQSGAVDRLLDGNQGEVDGERKKDRSQ